MNNFILRGKFIQSPNGTWVKREAIVSVGIVDRDDHKPFPDYALIGRNIYGNLWILGEFGTLLEAQEAAKELVDILSDDRG